MHAGYVQQRHHRWWCPCCLSLGKSLAALVGSALSDPSLDIEGDTTFQEGVDATEPKCIGGIEDWDMSVINLSSPTIGVLTHDSTSDETSRVSRV